MPAARPISFPRPLERGEPNCACAFAENSLVHETRFFNGSHFCAADTRSTYLCADRMALETDYEAKFDPKKYLEVYYTSLITGSDWTADFQLRHYHRFYEKYSCKWDKNSTKLLEFGAGPVIANVISAAPYVQEIVLASHTEIERNELTLWKNGVEGAHDWSPFFKYVVGKLETKPGEEAWMERATLLRGRLTITSCDIQQEHPIGIGSPSEAPFSIISTNLCLESACSTYDEYKAAVKKLGSLLQRGGYLVISGVERETFYRAAGQTQCKWFCLYITLAQIKEAMEEAGFDILIAERDPAPMHLIQNPIFFDYTSTIFLAGFKI